MLTNSFQKLESKLTKLENLILTSSTNEKIEEKAKKARKFANKYSYNLKELDYKIQTLREVKCCYNILARVKHIETRKCQEVTANILTLTLLKISTLICKRKKIF